jgi:hypothetical protein
MHLRQKRIHQQHLKDARDLLDATFLPLEKELILNKLWDRVSLIASGLAAELGLLVELVELDIQKDLRDNKIARDIPEPPMEPPPASELDGLPGDL